MKALILNSGMGKRMGSITEDHPKCMSEIYKEETIISRQLKQLVNLGVCDIVITTGYYDKILIDYVNSLNLDITYTFVNNPIYDKTNYIYSIYLAKEYLNDDLILMHGDLVFEDSVLLNIYNSKDSSITISSTLALPEKDFKAVVKDEKIEKIGIEFFDSAFAAQPLYKLNKKDWLVWLNKICEFCENEKVSCYAENALNKVSDECNIYPFDVNNKLCGEIDNPQDLEIITKRLLNIYKK